ncbi:hypothetical protein N2152v2_009458 [Parachlorella kessleri]
MQSTSEEDKATQQAGYTALGSPTAVDGRTVARNTSLDLENNRDDESEAEELCDHTHYSNRAPWLRALVLGANDGLVSRDAEHADIEKERHEQMKGPEAQARELEELAQIYVSRGLPYALARQVAVVLTEKDVIRAHARDELGIDIDDLSNPLQAAVVSACCFASGAAIPLLSSAFITNANTRLGVLCGATTVGLAFFGWLGAYLGGARVVLGTTRVLIGGWLAMGIVYAIGRAFNVSAA